MCIVNSDSPTTHCTINVANILKPANNGPVTDLGSWWNVAINTINNKLEINLKICRLFL